VELTGAEILVRCLDDEGTELIFGYPGGASLHINDALYKQEKIKHILVRHEQAATHAADGYARATGRTGVVLVTSGPGVTNTVTGLATAYMDSIPMVVISGQVATQLIGDDAFQEVDAVGITRPCVKHNFLVTDVKDLALTIKKAFFIAASGRPGPVLIDVPKDVTANKCLYNYPDTIKIRSYQPVRRGHPKQVKRAVDLLLQAKRPVVYAGGGIIQGEASQELTELVELLNAPCTNTLMGLGGFPASKPQYIGMLGMHGTYEANMVMHECDVMLCVGARFDDRITGDIHKFSPYAKIIHVDIDPSSISKNITAHIPVVGPAKAILGDMIGFIKSSDKKTDVDAMATWWQQIAQWQGINCLEFDRNSDKIKPQSVIEMLWQQTNGDAYVCSDVGQHQMWAAQYYHFDKPRRWVNSGGLGTMGFGLPAAMGVQLAHPDEQVLCITSDASVMMCIQELSTCMQYRLPIKIFSLNNRYMGMVRQWQEFFYDRRYANSYLDALPDFVKLAESFGHIGMTVEQPAELEATIAAALAEKERAVFVDIITDQTENVYPMIAAGRGHHEMQLRPAAQGEVIEGREIA